MDANQVEKFCDVVAQLIVPLATFAGTAPGERPHRRGRWCHQ
jgi:hypothetical protein